MRYFLVSLLLIVGCTADTFTGDDGGGGDSGMNQDVVDPPDGDPPSEASTKDADAGATGDGDSSVLPDVVVPPTHYRIFPTSQTYNGNLGGLSGADSICTTAGAKVSGSTGHWKAWLSSTQYDAKTRLFHSALPYVRVDGVQIASDWAHLTNGTNLGTSIGIDENGNDVNATDAGTRYVMTSTDEFASALLVLGTCDDFTSSTDTSTQTVVGSTATNAKHIWTAESAWVCSAPASLYCVEQP